MRLVIIESPYAGDVELNDCLGVIARHAELVFLEDYHFSARRMKLSHLLAASTAFATGGFFRGLLTLFHENGTSQPDGSFPSVPIGETLDLRETILRTMLFHPAQSYRSFATGELAPSKFWSVTSYPHVPVAALREISERLGADDMTDDYRRVFFDCTFARLMDVRDEAEVRFAREVINRYFTFDFFLEDNYFTKLQTLNQSVEKHEKRFGIDDAFFKRSVAAFLDEKERAGSKKTKLPKSFVEIPLTVQRKLAREGHYLSLFIRHPHAKIALETVRFLDTSAKIEKVLRVRTTNRHVVRAIAKKDDLMSAYPTRLALVSNPHTPVEISLKHLPGIRAGDMRRLAASRDISPELGANLRKRFGARQRSSA